MRRHSCCACWGGKAQLNGSIHAWSCLHAIHVVQFTATKLAAMADAAAEEGPTVQPLEVRYDPITGENTSQSPEFASDSVHPSGLMVLTASPSFPLDLLSKMLAFMGEMDGSSADVAAQPSPHTLPAAAATTEQPTESMPVHVALQHMMLSWFQSARSALCHPDVRLLPGAFPSPCCTSRIRCPSWRRRSL